MQPKPGTFLPSRAKEIVDRGELEMSDQLVPLYAFTCPRYVLAVTCDERLKEQTATKPMLRDSFAEGQKGRLEKFFASALSVGLTIFVATATGCSTSAPAAGAAQAQGDPPSVAAAASSDDPVPASGSSRLARLWAERSKDSFSPDFAIGPGDLLEISVPEMEQLKDCEARVSATGTIELPVLGVVEVGGMTEDQVKVALERKLARYMRDPDVDVSVKQYNSREVAVVGMVQKPGLYTLTSRSDTILDMISKAGGMGPDASSRIIFVPAPKNSNPALRKQLMASAASETSAGSAGGLPPGVTGAVRPASVESAEQSSEKAQPSESPSASAVDGVGQLPPNLRQSNPIEIDLSNARTTKELIDLPARPGDVIIVPASGEVMVQGWVANAGAFRIVPGMTALGAITAAGGAQFSSSATVLRTGEDGDKVQIPINLSRIKAGDERDVPVQSGDVVIVNSSAVGAVPYLAYTLFSKFGTGAYLPIPAF